MYRNNLKISGLILLVFLMLFGSSCQATPENIRSVEQHKNQETKGIEFSTQISDTWNEEINKKNLTVKINAEINVPTVEEFATWNYKNLNITQDVATKFLNYFSQGNTIYDAFEGMTKEEIQTSIEETRKRLENGGEVKNSGISQQDYEKWIEEESNFLTFLINEYEKAPREVDLIKSDGMFKSKGLSDADIAADRAFLREQGWDEEKINRAIEEQINISKNEKEINCIVNLGKKNYAIINIYNYSPNNQGIGYYNTDVGSIILEVNELKDDSNVKMSIDKSKAEEQANELLDDLEIKGMQMQSYGFFRIPQLDGTEKYGYAFLYTKKVENMDISYVKINQMDAVLATQELVSEPCFDEELLIGVDETGIVAFEWNYPKELGGKASSNIKLLSFDKIKEIFVKQIIAENVWNDEIESKTIYIDKLKLGFAKIKNKNSDDFLLIPAWDFYGYYIEQYPKNSEYFKNQQNNEIIYNKNGYSFVTLNAIDGSRIDRLRGY